MGLTSHGQLPTCQEAEASLAQEVITEKLEQREPWPGFLSLRRHLPLCRAQG